MKMRWIKRLLCRHIWQSELIFSPTKHSHNDVKSCIKCDKSVLLFSGDRAEWMKVNNYD